VTVTVGKGETMCAYRPPQQALRDFSPLNEGKARERGSMALCCNWKFSDGCELNVKRERIRMSYMISMISKCPSWRYHHQLSCRYGWYATSEMNPRVSMR
jgi:hypothetical protein